MSDYTIGTISSFASYMTGTQAEAQDQDEKASKLPNNLFVEKIPIQPNSKYAYIDSQYEERFRFFEGDEKFVQNLLEKMTNLERQL